MSIDKTMVRIRKDKDIIVDSCEVTHYFFF